MWFFNTGEETFCIRYFREGYGLFIGQDYLSWHKDAEAAAKLVFECRTGYKAWDERGTTDHPKDLSEWQPVAEIQKNGTIGTSHDPVVVPLECSCGHQIRESVARIRLIGKFRCPACNGTVVVGAEQVRAIIEKVRNELPNGHLPGRKQ